MWDPSVAHVCDRDETSDDNDPSSSSHQKMPGQDSDPLNSWKEARAFHSDLGLNLSLLAVWSQTLKHSELWKINSGAQEAVLSLNAV